MRGGVKGAALRSGDCGTVYPPNAPFVHGESGGMSHGVALSFWKKMAATTTRLLCKFRRAGRRWQPMAANGSVE